MLATFAAELIWAFTLVVSTSVAAWDPAPGPAVTSAVSWSMPPLGKPPLAPWGKPI